MCINCQLNNQHKKEGLHILVRCSNNPEYIYCTDSRYDNTIQNLIKLLPGITPNKRNAAEKLLQLRVHYFSYYLVNQKYTIDQYVEDLRHLVDLANQVHVKNYELLPLINLMFNKRDISFTGNLILSKIPRRKRNYARFIKKYDWIHSSLYLFLVKYKLIRE